MFQISIAMVFDVGEITGYPSLILLTLLPPPTSALTMNNKQIIT